MIYNRTSHHLHLHLHHGDPDDDVQPHLSSSMESSGWRRSASRLNVRGKELLLLDIFSFTSIRSLFHYHWVHRLISKQINHIFLRTSLRILARTPDHYAELHQTMSRKRIFLLLPFLAVGGWEQFELKVSGFVETFELSCSMSVASLPLSSRLRILPVILINNKQQ